MCWFNLLTSRYILKIFSLNVPSNPWQVLYLLFNSNFFPASLAKEIRRTIFFFTKPLRLCRYKSHIASSDLSAVYLVNYSALTTILPTIIIRPTDAVDDIHSSSIPQLIFFEHYKDLIYDSISFFTDASRRDHGEYVELAIYSPSDNLQILISFASIFTELICFNFSRSFSCTLLNLFSHLIVKSVIFTDSLNVMKSFTSPNFGHSNNLIIYHVKQKLYKIREVTFWYYHYSDSSPFGHF